MLMSDASVKTLAALRANPRLDPLTGTAPGLAPLQQWALKRIDQRFRLRRIAAAHGYAVYVLDARR
jgi:hypothetical protein